MREEIALPDGWRLEGHQEISTIVSCTNSRMN
jgi:hypothetical protein